MDILFYIDIDGTLRNWVVALDRFYREQFPGEDITPVTTYDLAPRYPRWGAEVYDIAFIQYPERMFLHDAEEYPRAIEAVNWLHNQDGVEVRLLSKQEGIRVQATDQWLVDHGVDESIKKVYISGISKGEYIDGEEPGDRFLVLVDDSGDELESAEGIVDVSVLMPRVWNLTFQEGWMNGQTFRPVDDLMAGVQQLLLDVRQYEETTEDLTIARKTGFFLVLGTVSVKGENNGR